MTRLPLLTELLIDVESLEGAFREDDSPSVVTYQGVVRRDRTGRGELAALEFEALNGKTDEVMAALQKDIEARWPGSAFAVQHRIGRVKVGETSVFVAVCGPDRSAAFHACHHILDQIKARISFRRRAIYADGAAVDCEDGHETLLISDSAITIPES